MASMEEHLAVREQYASVLYVYDLARPEEIRFSPIQMLSVARMALLAMTEYETEAELVNWEHNFLQIRYESGDSPSLQAVQAQLTFREMFKDLWQQGRLARARYMIRQWDHAADRWGEYLPNSASVSEPGLLRREHEQLAIN